MYPELRSASSARRRDALTIPRNLEPARPVAEGDGILEGHPRATGVPK